MKTKSRNYYKGALLGMTKGSPYIMQVYLGQEVYLASWIADHIQQYELAISSVYLGPKNV